MQSLPSPLRESSHTLPSKVVPVDSGSHPAVERARTRTPCPGSARAQVALALRFQPAEAPRAAYLPESCPSRNPGSG